MRLRKAFTMGLCALATLPFLSASCKAGTIAEIWPIAMIKKATVAKTLGKYELVVLIDSSGSMSKADCPLASAQEPANLPQTVPNSNELLSRWKWSEKELKKLEKDLGEHTEPLTVLTFNAASKLHNAANLKNLKSVFEETKPGGQTDTTAAVRKQLEAYMTRANSPAAKPLYLVVISDCAPDNPSSLTSTVIDASKKIGTKSESHIAFLQIGNDDRGEKFLQRLTRDVRKHNGNEEFVSTMSYRNLLQKGLDMALVELAQAAPKEATM